MSLTIESPCIIVFYIFLKVILALLSFLFSDGGVMLVLPLLCLSCDDNVMLMLTLLLLSCDIDVALMVISFLL